MKGELFINGKDAWLNWKVRLIENSYENLLKPPPMKEYSSNKFRSQPGKQVFILNPRIDERQVIVMFGITCNTRSEYLNTYEAFISEINDGVVEMNVVPINKTYKLYIEDYQSLSMGTSICAGKLSVRFNESHFDPVNPIFEVLATETLDFILTEDGKTIII